MRFLLLLVSHLIGRVLCIQLKPSVPQSFIEVRLSFDGPVGNVFRFVFDQDYYFNHPAPVKVTTLLLAVSFVVMLVAMWGGLQREGFSFLQLGTQFIEY